VDSLTYVAAGQRLNAGHALYSLSAGDWAVPLDPPYWTVPLLSPPIAGVLARPFALFGTAGIAAWWVLMGMILTATICILAVRGSCCAPPAQAQQPDESEGGHELQRHERTENRPRSGVPTPNHRQPPDGDQAGKDQTVEVADIEADPDGVRQYRDKGKRDERESTSPTLELWLTPTARVWPNPALAGSPTLLPSLPWRR
jgi:hypothetical protein